MEIIALKAHPRGFHGCLIHEESYQFFQLTRSGRFRPLKRYPIEAFEDHDHFAAIMMKYMGTTAFLLPPVPIQEITLEALDRVWNATRKLISDH